MLNLPGVALPLASCAVLPEGEVTAGIRPENLEWAAPNEPAIIDAPALVVEPLGSDTLVVVDLGGQDLHVRLPPKKVRRIGDAVRLRLPLEHLHLFDRQGRRMGDAGG